MNGRFSKALGKFHRGEKGITGLETAIILIAFVTVAAVLAYSVLSAGIFSSERGKEAVYRGLETAQASMQVAGNVYVGGTVNSTVPASSTVDDVEFQLKSILAGENVDLGKCTLNYKDDDVVVLGLSITDANVSTGFSGVLEPNDVQDIWINLSAYGLGVYDSFHIEIIPPTGAAIKLQRTLPGQIDAVMNLY